MGLKLEISESRSEISGKLLTCGAGVEWRSAGTII
jgi:hypothetical protein